MKPKYLKVYYDAEPERVMQLLKIQGGSTVGVMDDRICIYDLGESDFKEEKYHEATAQEFFEFHQQTLKRMDQVLNPVLS